MAPVPSFAPDARIRGCALGIVRPERRCHRRWPDHRCLEHLPAGDRTSLRPPRPFPSRACSRPRMTPALRGRRSSSFPSHSRPDLGQPVRCRTSVRRHGPRERRCASVAERTLPVKPAMGNEFAVPLGHRTGGHASGVASGSLRTWFATANATLRPTHAGWRSLLRTSAPPSLWR